MYVVRIHKAPSVAIVNKGQDDFGRPAVERIETPVYEERKLEVAHVTRQDAWDEVNRMNLWGPAVRGLSVHQV